MIELNLLPQEFKKKKRRIELPEIPLIPVCACFVGALILIQLFLSGLIFISKKQLVGLDKTWKDLAPKKAELDGIKKKISSINEKSSAIDSLIEKQLNWSRLLNELSNSLTPNIWLADLAYGEKIEKGTVTKQAGSPRKLGPGKQMAKRTPKTAKERQRKVGILTLSGFASGRGEEPTANVARFIRSLKGNKDFFKDFSDVELVSMKKSVVEGQDVMNFTLVCKFRPREKEE
ncbi:MAG: hypothetical protein WBC74_00985 [Candidatus Omnitrophota bacterium]